MYNSTKPPQTYQKKEVWRRKVIEKKPKSKQVLQYAAKGLLAPGVSLALFPYCIMHKENFREAVSQTLDEAAEELTSFIPNEKDFTGFLILLSNPTNSNNSFAIVSISFPFNS